MIRLVGFIEDEQWETNAVTCADKPGFPDIAERVGWGVRPTNTPTTMIKLSGELTESVVPALEKIRGASEEAARVWPGRIWKMTPLGSFAPCPR
jgi:hypothetical protein